MSGGRPFDFAKFRELIFYIGRAGLRSGRRGVAACLWFSDFEAYRRRGQSITGQRYLKAYRPGTIEAPRNVLRAVRLGLRLGGIEHRIVTGRMRRADAEFLADQWRDGVPV